MPKRKRRARSTEGRDSRGRIKAGFKLTKGGRVVRTSSSRSRTAKKGGSRRRRRSSGNGFSFF